ncbi:hypothetical protein ACJX0J_038136, partial [Zea mays]
MKATQTVPERGKRSHFLSSLSFFFLEPEARTCRMLAQGPICFQRALHEPVLVVILYHIAQE